MSGVWTDRPRDDVDSYVVSDLFPQDDGAGTSVLVPSGPPRGLDPEDRSPSSHRRLPDLLLG